MKRRVSGLLLALLFAGTAAAQQHVNEKRLWSTLEKLSEFGRPPAEDGKPTGFDAGVTRVGFSEEDRAARDYVMGLLRDAGLTVRVDAAGNIFALRPGTEELPALLFGSHIDSVPNGGNFDGQVGSMGAIEVIRALNDHKVRTRHPLEVVIWTNEEGHHFRKGLFGSTAAAGLMEQDVIHRTDEHGATVADWLRRYGQDPAKLQGARIPKDRYAAYLELHIEQGGILDERKIQIGVVEGIVGIQWRTCTARGFANHAGTTPMGKRRDAFLAVAQAALAVREEVRREGGRQVGTVGYVKVEPNAGNVVPGQVEFIVELRDLDATIYERTWLRIEKRFTEIAAAENVSIECQLVADERPALTTPAIRDALREAARAAGYSTLDLPSGAGHDAQQVAHFAPIGMIFVPSRDGISHSPREFTPPADVARGAEVLLRTLLLLDERLDRKD
jgi:N-carbamoyl-L-amino-acid hydrolase